MRDLRCLVGLHAWRSTRGREWIEFYEPIGPSLFAPFTHWFWNNRCARCGVEIEMMDYSKDLRT